MSIYAYTRVLEELVGILDQISQKVPPHFQDKVSRLNAKRVALYGVVKEELEQHRKGNPDESAQHGKLA